MKLIIYPLLLQKYIICDLKLIDIKEKHNQSKSVSEILRLNISNFNAIQIVIHKV